MPYNNLYLSPMHSGKVQTSLSFCVVLLTQSMDLDDDSDKKNRNLTAVGSIAYKLKEWFNKYVIRSIIFWAPLYVVVENEWILYLT